MRERKTRIIIFFSKSIRLRRASVSSWLANSFVANLKKCCLQQACFTERIISKGCQNLIVIIYRPVRPIGSESVSIQEHINILEAYSQDHAGITLYRLLSYHRLPVYPISGAPECLLRLIARKGRRENLDALWALSRQPSRFSTTNVGTYGSTPDYRPILDSTDRSVLTDGALAQIQSDTLFIRTDKF